MLTELSLRNFKSWQSIDKMRLAPFTGLFGSNSSGKSSIIQALLMLKQTVESPDRAQVLSLGDDKGPSPLGSFKDVVFQHSTDGQLECSVSWQLPDPLRVKDPEMKNAVVLQGRDLTFRTSVRANQSGRMLVTEMEYTFDKVSFFMELEGGEKYRLRTEPEDRIKLKRNPGRVWPLPAPVKCYGFPDQVKAYYQNAGFLSDFELAFEELFARTYYLGPLREYPRRQYTWAGGQPVDMGQRGERVIDALLASRERGQTVSLGPKRKRKTVEEMVAHWLKQLGLIHSFSVEGIKDSNIYRVVVKKNSSASKVSITDVGFGVSQVLPALALCYYVPEGSTVILEQPEIHLHPAVQSGLADVFINAIKTRNIQIIVESHSEHLLRRLQRRIAEEGFAQSDTALYFCAMENGCSMLRPLDVDLVGRISNWPQDFFGDEFGEIAATERAILERTS